MTVTRHRTVYSGISVIPCVICFCTLLQTGCADFKLFGDRSSTSSTIQQEDEKDREFAEGADRPATPKTQYAYARVLASQRQDAACDMLLSKMISEQPRFMAAYLLQAEVRMRMRRVDDAIETLQSALAISPRDHILLNNLGVCYLMKPDCSNAFQCFVGAAAIQPSNARYRANMALALGLLDRKEESASLYKQVVSVKDAEHNVSLLSSARDAFLGISAPAASPTTQTTQPSAEGNPPGESVRPDKPSTSANGSASLAEPRAGA